MGFAISKPERASKSGSKGLQPGILLAGGDKSSQATDIAVALEVARSLKEQ
jgi:hypothetical protein